MFCCDFSPQVIPSAEAEHLSTYLKYICFAHILFGVLYIFTGGQYIGIGIMDLIFAWFVYLCYCTYSYTYIAFYIWILTLNMISLVSYFGTLVQYFTKYYNDLGGMYFYIFMLFGSEISFYCIAIYVSYRSYKEFKALAIMPLEGNRAGQCTFL